MDGGSPAATSSLAATWPLVGREAELTRIAEAMRDEDCRGVVVSAGGRRRQVAPRARGASPRPSATARWPSGCRRRAARRRSRSAPSPACSPTTCAPTTRSSSCAAAPTRCASAARRAARSCSASTTRSCSIPRRPRSCCTSTTTGSAFVVATVRTGEPCPDAIVSLWKDAGAQRLELGRSRATRPATLVEAALGGPVEQARAALGARAQPGQRAVRRASWCSARSRAGALAQLAGSGGWRAAAGVRASLVELVARADGRAQRRRARAGRAARARRAAAAREIERAGRRRRARRRRGARPGPVDARASAATSGSRTRCTARSCAAELPGAARAARCGCELAAALQERDPLAPDDALRDRALAARRGRADPAAAARSTPPRAANLAGDPELGAQLARAGRRRRRRRAARCCSRARTPCASASRRPRRRSPRHEDAVEPRRPAATPSTTSSSACACCSGASAARRTRAALLDRRAGVVGRSGVAAPAAAAAAAASPALGRLRRRRSTASTAALADPGPRRRTPPMAEPRLRRHAVLRRPARARRSRWPSAPAAGPARATTATRSRSASGR